MKFTINNARKRVHVEDEASGFDEFLEIQEGSTAEETIVAAGYTYDASCTVEVDPEIKKSNLSVSNIDEMFGSFNTPDTQIGAHTFLLKYAQMFKDINPNGTFEIQPEPIPDYALSRNNYPKGIHIYMDGNREVEAKCLSLFEQMKVDLDMLTDDLAEIDFSFVSLEPPQ